MIRDCPSSMANPPSLRQALSAGFALAFATKGLGYTSLAILLRNACVERTFRFATVLLSALVGIWSVAGIMRFALGADTTLVAPQKSSWIGFAVVSLTIQASQVALVLWLILPLRLPLGKKFECITWFCCIIPVVFAMTIVRLVYTPDNTFGLDFTFNNTTMVIVLLVETNLVLVSAACSGLRGLLNQLSTGFLVADTTTLSSSRRASAITWGSRSGRAGKSTESSKNSNLGLSNLGSSDPGTTSATSATSTTVAQDGSQYAATVQSGRVESDSPGNEAIMIRRTIEVDASNVDQLDDRQRPAQSAGLDTP